MLPVHGAVDVVGIALVVAGSAKGHAQVDALAFDDRAGRIEEVAVGPAREFPQLLRQGFASERAGGQHGDLTGAGQLGVLPPLHRHQWVLLEGGGEGGAVAAPINGQGAACRDGVGVGGANHHRTQAPQFLLKQACGPIAT